MSIRKRVVICLAVAVLLCIGATSSAVRAQEPASVTIFGAASLTNAVTEIAGNFSTQGKGKTVLSFAASSTLAKQIENGAPANVFISADEEWMNYLANKQMIVPDTRSTLLGNRLVLIAPADSTLQVQIAAGFPLAKILGDKRLATGDPDHVPVGKYAKTALQKLGAWADVENKLARADNVRSALALVERDECPLGIVYATDAAITKKVKVVGVFPEDSHPPVVYPVALVTGHDSPASRSFLAFLKTPESKAIFEKFGFVVR